MNLESILTEFFLSNWGKFTAGGLIILVLKICRLPKVKGWFGEKLVERGLRKLDPAAYHVFHDLYLPRPDGKGTTQIDHLVLSRFGLFVIETKNYQGWIFGDEKQRQWTQLIYKVKHKFQNPLHQNALHINALRQLLDLDKSAFFNLIFFIGDCTFKTDLPPNVMTRGLVKFIKKYRDPILCDAKLDDAITTITRLVAETNKKLVAKLHVKQRRDAKNPNRTKLLAPAKNTQKSRVASKKSLMTDRAIANHNASEATLKAEAPRSEVFKPETAITKAPPFSDAQLAPQPQASSSAPVLQDQEHNPSSQGAPSCPICNEAMLMRIAKRGQNTGNQFWGCSSFPKCRGTI